MMARPTGLQRAGVSAWLVLIVAACSPSTSFLEEPIEPAEGASAISEPTNAKPQIAPAFLEPWPTDFTQEELTDSALAKAFEYFDASLAGPQKSISVVVEDSVSPNLREPIQSVAQGTISRLSPVAHEDHVAFVGISIEWLMQNAAKRGLSLPENGNGIDQPKIPFEEWGPGAFPEGLPSGWAHGNLVWIGVANSWTLNEAHWVTGHEVFHSVHLTLDQGNMFEVYADDDLRNRPRWLIEGGANFFSYAVLDHMSLYEYKSPRLAEGIWSLKEYESWWSSESAYNYGQKAIEYLVATVGVEKTLGIYSHMGQGMYFQDAFEESTGISVEDFYDLFDSHVAGL